MGEVTELINSYFGCLHLFLGLVKSCLALDLIQGDQIRGLEVVLV